MTYTKKFYSIESFHDGMHNINHAWMNDDELKILSDKFNKHKVTYEIYQLSRDMTQDEQDKIIVPSFEEILECKL